MVIVNDQYPHLVYLTCIKLQICEHFVFIGYRILQKYNEIRKNTLLAQICVLSDAISRLILFEWEITFLKNYITPEGDVSQNVL